MNPAWLSVHAYGPQEVASRVLNDRGRVEEAIRVLNSIIVKNASDTGATVHIVSPVPTALAKLPEESVAWVLEEFARVGWNVEYREILGPEVGAILTLEPREADEAR